MPTKPPDAKVPILDMVVGMLINEGGRQVAVTRIRLESL